MSRFYMVWVLMVTLAGLAYSQEVLVTEASSGESIQQVTIISDDDNKAAITDATGRADISHISKTARLIFRHPSYRSVTLTFPELSAMNYRVSLRERVRSLGNTVVSASRWEQNPDEIPQSIAKIEPKDIQLANPATTADMLGNTGQVFIQKSQLGGGSPIIRGFAANSVLIVIDGVRMNNAIYRSGNLQNVISLDANTLQEAEVVFGPGSVIYGSDALGGVMDFHTRKPKFTEQGQLSGRLMTRFGTAAQEATGSTQLSYTSPRFTSFTSLTFSRFGDLRTGANRTNDFPDFGKRLQYVARRGGKDVIITNPNVNRQTGSGYNQTNLLQKFRWKAGAFTDVSYNFHLSTTSNIPRYDRLIQRGKNGKLKNAEWFYGPQAWQMHQLQLGFYYPQNLFDQVKITTAYQRMEESRNTRKFGNNSLTRRLEKVDALSLNIDFEKSLSEFSEIYYGLEMVYNHVNSSATKRNINTGETSPAATRYPDGGSRWNSLAAYMGAKQRIGKGVFLNSGLRYNYVSLHSKFKEQRFFNFPFDQINLSNGALSGNLGLVYLPSDRWKFSTLFSTGFRAPNVDDAGKVFDSEPGNVVVPNPGLKPETSYNLEYGIQRKLSRGFRVELVNFFSFLRNALVRRNFTFNGQSKILFDGELSRVQAEVNAGRAFIWGININAALDISSGLALKSNLTYTDGEDSLEKVPLRHVTPIFGQTSLELEQKKLSAQFLVRYSGGFSFDELAPSEQNKTHLYIKAGALPWYTLHLNCSYALSKSFRIGLNLENLLDKHYRPYSSGISAPGFNAVLSVTGNW